MKSYNNQEQYCSANKDWAADNSKNCENVNKQCTKTCSKPCSKPCSNSCYKPWPNAHHKPRPIPPPKPCPPPCQDPCSNVNICEENKWVAAWASPLSRAYAPGDPTSILGLPSVPTFYLSPVVDRTIRIQARITACGNQIRLRFQNQVKDSVAQGEGIFIPNPVTLRLTEIRVGLQSQNQNIQPGTNSLVTFNGGSTSIEIPPGGMVISDYLPFNVQRGQILLVSIYTENSNVNPTAIYADQTINFLALEPGNQTNNDTFALDTSTTIVGSVWLSGIDVLTKCEGRTILAFGDSITRGTNSSFNQFLDYPNQLANRLTDRACSYGVINLGIAGNQITNGGSVPIAAVNSFPYFGASALERLNRDVLNQTNVKYIIFMEGVNDIQFALRTPEQIISGIYQFVRQIRIARPGIKIYGSPLTPYKGSALWSPTGEAIRQAVNQWIISSGVFDAIINFAQVLADPADPERLLPAYASVDNLHPNDAGYSAMANAIPLQLFCL